jgi:hypothetical protein
VQAIEAARSPAGGRALLSAESLSVYHEIHRLKVELELEAAAVLWRISEVVSALCDSNEALQPAASGRRVSLDPEWASARRNEISRRRPEIPGNLGLNGSGPPEAPVANGNPAREPEAAPPNGNPAPDWVPSPPVLMVYPAMPPRRRLWPFREKRQRLPMLSG